MNKLIEEMMKTREPVHQKCRGEGFSPEELKYLKGTTCSRIEPIDVFEIIDEETGQVDTEVKSVSSKEDPACRCTAYINPSRWWIHGRSCPLADHFKPLMVKEISEKQRAGQQKQKKKK